MDWQGWFALSLTGVALLLMSVGRFGPHLVMLGVLIVLSASGIISADQALAGFSNSGLITVVAMFVVAAGIHHSGGVDLVVHHLLRSPRTVRSAQARIESRGDGTQATSWLAPRAAASRSTFSRRRAPTQRPR